MNEREIIIFLNKYFLQIVANTVFSILHITSHFLVKIKQSILFVNLKLCKDISVKPSIP